MTRPQSIPRGFCDCLVVSSTAHLVLDGARVLLFVYRFGPKNPSHGPTVSDPRRRPWAPVIQMVENGHALAARI